MANGLLTIVFACQLVSVGWLMHVQQCTSCLCESQYSSHACGRTLSNAHDVIELDKPVSLQ